MQAHQNALEICKAHYGNEPHVDTAHASDGIGLTYLAQNDYINASQYIQQAFDIKTHLYGEQTDHIHRAHSFAYLGNICMHQQTPQEAIYYYAEALKIYEGVHKSQTDHPDLADIHIQLGKARAQLEEFEKAVEHYTQATKTQVAHFRLENQIDAQLDLYIPTNTTQKKGTNEKPQPLFQQVDAFLAHNQDNLMLLNGDAGAGKSIYGRLLEKQLWASYQDNTSPIPLFISLPALQNSDKAMQETLSNYGWDVATIAYLKAQSQKKRPAKEEEEAKYSEEEDKKTRKEYTPPPVFKKRLD